MNLMPWNRSQDSRDAGWPLADLQREMNHLLERFWGPIAESAPTLPFGAGDWSPALDLKETETAYQVKIELPGMKPEDIDIHLSGSTLTIKGERKELKEDKKETYHRIERRTGSFHRVIPLPGEVEQGKVEAKCDKGVLELTLPKAAGNQAKKIAVKAGDARG